MSKLAAAVNAYRRSSATVSDMRIARFDGLCVMFVVLGATSLACTQFGEAVSETPPVEHARSADPTAPAQNDGPPERDSSSADPVGDDAGDDPTEPVPAGGCKGAVDCERVVFVSSVSFDAYAIGGLHAADAKCNALATLADDDRVAGREFVAWLSDGSTSPAARLVHGTRPYIRPDGARIASSFDELTSSEPLDVAIALDEDGDHQSGPVWTGTDPNGASTGESCAGWKATTGVATRGYITAVTPRWTNAGPPLTEPGSCAEDAARIYCFEK